MKIRGVGRPKKKDPRKLNFSIKGNEADRDKLVYVMEQLNLGVGEAWRYCLDEVYERLRAEEYYRGIRF